MSEKIRVTLRGGGDVVQLSMNPEQITRAGSARVAALDTLVKPIEKHTGAGIAVYSWSGILPGRDRRDRAYVMRNRWRNSLAVDRQLDQWRRRGTRLSLTISGSNFTDDVFIVSYDSTISGGMGDIDYSIELHEFRSIETRRREKKKKKKRDRDRKKGDRDRRKGGRPSRDGRVVTYRVKANDSLWLIAKRFLDRGARWREIYQDNKKPKGPITNPDVLQVGWVLKIDKRESR